jgi:CelD/BcsL family acetyltransferase involved in cellulose biosynthesis
LETEWLELLRDSPLNHIFLTPFWVAAWWRHLGSGELRLLSLRQEGKLMAVAPLVKRGRVFCLAADRDICDYADIVVRCGEEAGVAGALLDYLAHHEADFHFYPLLPQSTLLSHLAPLARQRGYTVATQELTSSVSLELPRSWEEYLGTLRGKERHEVRRKLRRLHEAGGVNFSTTAATPSRVEQFLSMFRSSRADKDEFLTPQREAFFRTIMDEMEDRGHLRLYFLEVAERPVAAALCFEYGDTLYLYNNGFDPQQSALSPGLMSKVLALQDAIRAGKRIFDFLSGAETYKLRLGGSEVTLSQLVGERPVVGGGE